MASISNKTHTDRSRETLLQSAFVKGQQRARHIARLSLEMTAAHPQTFVMQQAERVWSQKKEGYLEPLWVFRVETAQARDFVVQSVKALQFKFFGCQNELIYDKISFLSKVADTCTRNLGLGNCSILGVTSCDWKLKGLALIDFAKGKTHLQYIATTPDRPIPGAAIALIEEILHISLERGFLGAFHLYSLPEAYSFYQHLGMKGPRWKVQMPLWQIPTFLRDFGGRAIPLYRTPFTPSPALLVEEEVEIEEEEKT